MDTKKSNVITTINKWIIALSIFGAFCILIGYIGLFCINHLNSNKIKELQKRPKIVYIHDLDTISISKLRDSIKFINLMNSLYFEKNQKLKKEVDLYYKLKDSCFKRALRLDSLLTECQQRNKMDSATISNLKKEISDCSYKVKEFGKLIDTHNKHVQEYDQKEKKYNETISELRLELDSCKQKRRGFLSFFQRK